MIIYTYQSNLVLNELRKNVEYRAKPSIAYKGEYAALIDLLQLDCECPIFGVIKGRRQLTGGKVSGAVRLTLDVPDSEIKLTEYSTWADFIYAYRYANPNKYTTLRPNEEVTTRRYDEILEDLKTQRKPSEYKSPQVVLEKIKPGWVKSYRVMHGKGFIEKIKAKFSR